MKGWRTVSLGDFADSVDYGVTASATQQPSGPKFLRITDIQNGEVNWSTVPWCECDARSAANSRLKLGDIVFARTGATTGKSFLIRECPDDAVFASYLIRVRVGDSVEPCYLSHFFNSPDYWAQITQSTRGVAQPGVNASTLKTLKIPLPSLPEQKRIAAILDKADSIRRKRHEAVRLTEELLRSVFLNMFGDPVTNPKGWEKSKLSEVVVGKYGIKAGPFGSSLKKEDYTTSGYRIYGQEQVIAGRFDIGDYFIGERKFQQLKGCEVAEGDLLVSLVGSFGKVLVVPSGVEPGIINPRLLKITPNRDLVTPIFLAAVIGNPSIQAAFGQMAHGGTMGILNVGLLKQLDVILPPVKLQQEFARRLECVNKLENALQHALAGTGALFDSLLQRAFKGGL